MLLFYVRHGDPIYAPDSLTPLGHRQAESVARRLSTFGVDEIYASTSTRAIQTATPTAEICKLPITELDFANEGHAWREFTVKDEDGWEHLQWVCFCPWAKELMLSEECLSLGNRWYSHPAFSESKIAQGIERIDREADAFLESLGYRHDRTTRSYLPIAPTEKRIALFAHQGFGMAFLSSILDIPYPYFATHFDMQHTGVTVIEWNCEHLMPSGRIVPRVLQLSCDAHLWRDGLPTSYQNRIRF